MYVNVAVDLGEFDDDDLIEELEDRGIVLNEDDNELLNVIKQSLYSIWLKRRMEQDYQRELDTLIYNSIGKVL
jgi:hypothetical protein